MSQNHENFELEEVGLVLSKPYTFLAASPDRLSKCDGHKASVVNNNLHLKNNHKYYSQTLTQILVCGVNQCDLVVWITKDVINLVISQIVKNETFCNSLVTRVKKFTTDFRKPQPLNDRIKVESSQDFPNLGSDKVFCSCKRPKFGKMICYKIARQSSSTISV